MTTTAQNFQLEKGLFPNLMLGIPAKHLKKLGSEAVEGYKTDLASRSKWEKSKVNQSKLYALQRDQKDFPWPDCSNVAMPMLTMAVSQYAARSFEELIPAKNIVKEVPYLPTEDNIDIAKRKSQYLNYHFMFKDRNFKRSMDRSMLKQGIEGTLMRKVFYDPKKGQIVSDYVNTSDFVVHSSTRELEDSPRYTQRHYPTVNDIRIDMRNGIYRKDKETKKIIEERSVAKLDEIKTQHLKNLGLVSTENGDEIIVRRLILEQHVDIDLKGDGSIKKPHIMFVDYDTETVVRIISRENPKTGKKMTQYIDYDFLPNPEGFYGYGFGLFLEGLNEALNSVINQLIDSGTLQNMQTGIVLKKKGMKRGNVDIQMGKFVEVDPGGGDDVRKIVSPFSFGSPSPVLFSLLGVLQTYADRLTTVTDQQTGDAQKSDTTATGVALLIEQGLKFFSSIHRRNHMNFQKELEIIENMYNLYLDVEDYKKVVINPADMVNPETGEKISDEDINAMLEADFGTTNFIVPVSNPNIISKQEKVAVAQLVLDTTTKSPVTANNLQAIYEAHVNLFEQLGIPDAEIEKFVPQPPSEEPPDLPQEEENQMFINEQQIDALEQQNHEEHLQVIVEFEESPFFEQMTATGKKFLDQHKRQHLGFQYIIEAGTKKFNENQPPQQQQQQLGLPPNG